MEREGQTQSSPPSFFVTLTGMQSTGLRGPQSRQSRRNGEPRLFSAIQPFLTVCAEMQQTSRKTRQSEAAQNKQDESTTGSWQCTPAFVPSNLVAKQPRSFLRLQKGALSLLLTPDRAEKHRVLLWLPQTEPRCEPRNISTIARAVCDPLPLCISSDVVRVCQVGSCSRRTQRVDFFFWLPERRAQFLRFVRECPNQFPRRWRFCEGRTWNERRRAQKAMELSRSVANGTPKGVTVMRADPLTDCNPFAPLRSQGLSTLTRHTQPRGPPRSNGVVGNVDRPVRKPGAHVIARSHTRRRPARKITRHTQHRATGIVGINHASRSHMRNGMRAPARPHPLRQPALPITRHTLPLSNGAAGIGRAASSTARASLQTVKFIGPITEALLRKVGINSVDELLAQVPKANLLKKWGISQRKRVWKEIEARRMAQATATGLGTPVLAATATAVATVVPPRRCNACLSTRHTRPQHAGDAGDTSTKLPDTLQSIEGIGEKSTLALHAAGINTVPELLAQATRAETLKSWGIRKWRVLWAKLEQLKKAQAEHGKNGNRCGRTAAEAPTPLRLTGGAHSQQAANAVRGIFPVQGPPPLCQFTATTTTISWANLGPGVIPLSQRRWNGGQPQLLQQVLQRTRVIAGTVAADGNCLFSTVVRSLGLTRSAAALRANVVEHIRHHQDHYHGFVAENEFGGYLDEMAQDGTWGGNMEMQAIANIHRVTIGVLDQQEGAGLRFHRINPDAEFGVSGSGAVARGSILLLRHSFHFRPLLRTRWWVQRAAQHQSAPRAAPTAAARPTAQRSSHRPAQPATTGSTVVTQPQAAASGPAAQDRRTRNTTQALRIATLNASGLHHGKVNSVLAAANSLRLDVLGVTETHQTADGGAQTRMPGYGWFGKAGKSKRSGGVGMWVAHWLLPCVSRPSIPPDAEVEDAIWMVIHENRPTTRNGEVVVMTRTLAICSVYLRPVSALPAADCALRLQKLTKAIDFLRQHHQASIIIMGDVNAKLGRASEAASSSSSSSGLTPPVPGHFGRRTVDTRGRAIVKWLTRMELWSNHGLKKPSTTSLLASFTNRGYPISLLDYMFASSDLRCDTGLGDLKAETAVDVESDHLLMSSQVENLIKRVRNSRRRGSCRRRRGGAAAASGRRQGGYHTAQLREGAGVTIDERNRSAALRLRMKLSAEAAFATAAPDGVNPTATPEEELGSWMKRFKGAVPQQLRPKPRQRSSHQNRFSPKSQLVWTDEQCRQTKRDQQKAYRRARNAINANGGAICEGLTAGLWSDYKRARRQAVIARRQAAAKLKAATRHRLNKAHTIDPIHFWSLIRRLNSIDNPATAIATAKRDCLVLRDPHNRGCLTANADECAAVLRDQFACVCAEPAPPSDRLERRMSDESFVERFKFDELAQLPSTPPTLDADITVAEVLYAAHALRSLAAPGVDGLDALLLKACLPKTADIDQRNRRNGAPDPLDNPVVLSLHRLMASFWRSEHVPAQLTQGRITPILKPAGDANTASSFRPISVQPLLGKLYTHIILARLNAPLDAKLSPAQAGFRPGRGCIEQTITLHDSLTRRRAAGLPSVVVFIDLQKAYDQVWRKMLWAKLARFGVRGKMLRVLRDLYTNASQVVQVADSTSPPFEAEMGVKQGCLLSPLLFNCWLDDLVGRERLERDDLLVRIPGRSGMLLLSALLFADDIVIIAANESQAQAKLDALTAWCDENAAMVGIAKCGAMLVQVPGQAARSADLALTIQRKQVPVVKQYKYLGTMITDNLNWDTEIARRTKATQGIIFGLKGVLRDKKIAVATRLHVLKTKVWPVALWGSEAWGGNKAAFEKMDGWMKRAYRWILGAWKGVPVEALYLELGVRPLVYEAWARRLTLLKKMKENGSRNQILARLVALGPQLCTGSIPSARSWLQRSLRIAGRLGFPTLEELRESGPHEECMRAKIVAAEELQRSSIRKSSLELIRTTDWDKRDWTKAEAYRPPAYLCAWDQPEGRRILFLLRAGSLTLHHRMRHLPHRLTSTWKKSKPPATESNKRLRQMAEGRCLLDDHCCQQEAMETQSHFLLECRALSRQRAILMAAWRRLTSRGDGRRQVPTGPTDLCVSDLLGGKIWTSSTKAQQKDVRVCLLQLEYMFVHRVALLRAARWSPPGAQGSSSQGS